MSILRKRSAANKVYIPSTARENQYLIAEFELSDSVISHVLSGQPNHDISRFYHHFSDTFFTLLNQSQLKNALVIANDKLPRVRYNTEMHQWQTNQQILFFYNPEYHELQKSFFDEQYRAKKISMLFLVAGQSIRQNSAAYHQQVTQFLYRLAETINLSTDSIRVRDHQHITYDLFSREKGHTETQAHKMRSIDLRYKQHSVELPPLKSALTYAVASLPINKKLQQLCDCDLQSDDPYNPLYTQIADAFITSAKRFNLNNGAVIANGLVPIVRNSKHDEVSTVGELQMLGYNTENTQYGFICKWNAAELVDSVQFIFVASKEHKTEQGYGRFLNHIEKALTLMADKLALSAHKDELTVRFHQHIAYNLSAS